jgi:hypothetical protein
MKRQIAMVILVIFTAFTFSGCLVATDALRVGGTAVEVLSTDKKDEEMSKRHWDPGKKKYYRYDKNGDKVYE